MKVVLVIGLQFLHLSSSIRRIYERVDVVSGGDVYDSKVNDSFKDNATVLTEGKYQSTCTVCKSKFDGHCDGYADKVVYFGGLKRCQASTLGQKCTECIHVVAEEEPANITHSKEHGWTEFDVGTGDQVTYDFLTNEEKSRKQK